MQKLEMVGDAGVLPSSSSARESESAMPPAALRRGLLLYSAVLTAIGSSVAFGALRRPRSPPRSRARAAPSGPRRFLGASSEPTDHGHNPRRRPLLHHLPPPTSPPTWPRPRRRPKARTDPRQRCLEYCQPGQHLGLHSPEGVRGQLPPENTGKRVLRPPTSSIWGPGTASVTPVDRIRHPPAETGCRGPEAPLGARLRPLGQHRPHVWRVGVVKTAPHFARLARSSRGPQPQWRHVRLGLTAVPAPLRRSRSRRSSSRQRRSTVLSRSTWTSIRFDIDFAGHVSNITYIRWLEIGRIQLLNDVGFQTHDLLESGLATACDTHRDRVPEAAEARRPCAHVPGSRRAAGRVGDHRLSASRRMTSSQPPPDNWVSSSTGNTGKPSRVSPEFRETILAVSPAAPRLAGTPRASRW